MWAADPVEAGVHAGMQQRRKLLSAITMPKQAAVVKMGGLGGPTSVIGVAPPSDRWPHFNVDLIE
jgi:hypothetical protein